MKELDQCQEQLIGELLKAGAVYQQPVSYPVDYGHGAPATATGAPNDPPPEQQQIQPHQRNIRFNDQLSSKYREFVHASSININEIKTVKYNPILLSYVRGKMSELDERDMMEILKYV